jgi:hypothetical protein
METQPVFGFKELFNSLIGEIAKALSDRDGEPRPQQFTRSQTAAHMVTGFLPRDVIEAMLAGHCVMLHELMVQAVGEFFRAEAGPKTRGMRSAILAMDRAFGRNLADFDRYQKREAEGRRDAPEAEGPAVATETEIADRVRRHREQAAAQDGRKQAGAAEGREAARNGKAEITRPRAGAIEACRTNPEAMEALNASDMARFARLMGVENPSEVYVTAATEEMRTLNGQGARGVAVGTHHGKEPLPMGGRDSGVG